MHKIKVAHIADTHLGSIYANLPYEKSKQRSKEAIYSFIKTINDCSDCDVILLSGDIFESGDVPTFVADMFLSAISEIKDTHVFYSCGNHDSYFTEIIKYCIKNAPDNLHIFAPDVISSIIVESKKVKIYGVSFSNEHQYESLFSTMPECESDYINILCMHGDVMSGQYNPININDFSMFHIDYVALGHIHQFSGIKNIGSCFYAYPGITEGRGFDECGKKGYIKGYISKDFNNLEFYSCAKRIYIDEKIDICDYGSEYEIIDTMNSLCLSPENICRFTFVGENNLDKQLDTKFLEGQCMAFYCICIDNTKTKVSIEDYVGFPGLLGVCATETRNKIDASDNHEEKEIYKNAFKLLVNIFENK